MWASLSKCFCHRLFYSGMDFKNFVNFIVFSSSGQWPDGFLVSFSVCSPSVGSIVNIFHILFFDSSSIIWSLSSLGRGGLMWASSFNVGCMNLHFEAPWSSGFMILHMFEKAITKFKFVLFLWCKRYLDNTWWFIADFNIPVDYWNICIY